MADAKKVVEGLNILMKTGLNVEVDAQHDKLFAGPGIDGEISKEDRTKLEELGWHFSVEFDCWAIFT